MWPHLSILVIVVWWGENDGVVAVIDTVVNTSHCGLQFPQDTADGTFSGWKRSQGHQTGNGGRVQGQHCHATVYTDDTGEPVDVHFWFVCLCILLAGSMGRSEQVGGGMEDRGWGTGGEWVWGLESKINWWIDLQYSRIKIFRLMMCPRWNYNRHKTEYSDTDKIAQRYKPVSYTHLTLPTKLIV